MRAREAGTRRVEGVSSVVGMLEVSRHGVCEEELGVGGPVRESLASFLLLVLLIRDCHGGWADGFDADTPSCVKVQVKRSFVGS